MSESKSATLDEFFDEKTPQEGKKVKNLLYWTGHPFVDAGLAAILLIAKKDRPEDLTRKDVEKAIKFTSELYARKEWNSGYLHGMIFPNSGILMANPSMAKKRTAEEIAKNLRSLLSDFSEGNPKCVLCGCRKSIYEKRSLPLIFSPSWNRKSS